MSLAVNNQVSDQYSEDNYPVYLLDSKEGSRSAQPAYNVEKLIEAIFDYYDVEVDTNDFITGIYEYSDCYMKIPVNFMAKDVLLTDKIRTVTYNLNGLGRIADQVDLGVVAKNADTSKFIIAKEFLFSSTTRNCHIPQENTKYDITGSGIKTNYKSEFELHYLNDNDDEEIVPMSGYTYTGVLSPAIGIYLYEDLVYTFYSDSDCFDTTIAADLALITGTLSLKYGDVVSVKLGFKANNLRIDVPISYDDSTGLFSGTTKTIDMINGFYHNIEHIIRDATIDITGLIGTVNGYLHINNSYDTAIDVGSFDLVPVEDYYEARYGDKALMYYSYDNTDLTMYDVIEMITKRFNLSLKDQTSGVIKFMQEPRFYSDSYIVLDHKISKRVNKSFIRNDVKSISITNEDYGNINDRVNALDDDNKILVFDVNKFVIDESSFVKKEFELGSTIQNNLVYGKKLSASEIDSWEFLDLENDTALWNAGN